MTFAPVQAASIFCAALFLPAVPFIYMRSSAQPWVVSLDVGASAIVCAGLFWAGARLAARPHTLKSLALAVLITWIVSLSAGELGKLHPSVYDPYTVTALKLVPVFLAGWQLAPKARTDEG